LYVLKFLLNIEEDGFKGNLGMPNALNQIVDERGWNLENTYVCV